MYRTPAFPDTYCPPTSGRRVFPASSSRTFSTVLGRSITTAKSSTSTSRPTASLLLSPAEVAPPPRGSWRRSCPYTRRFSPALLPLHHAYLGPRRTPMSARPTMLCALVPSRGAVEHPAPSPPALLAPPCFACPSTCAILISIRHASQSRLLDRALPPLQTPPPREPDSAIASVSFPSAGRAAHVHLDDMRNFDLGSPNDGWWEKVREEEEEEEEGVKSAGDGDSDSAPRSRRGSANKRRRAAASHRMGGSYCGMDGWRSPRQGRGGGVSFVVRMGGSVSFTEGDVDYMVCTAVLVGVVVRSVVKAVGAVGYGADVARRSTPTFSVEMVLLYFTLQRAHAQSTAGGIVAFARALFDWDPSIGPLPPLPTYSRTLLHGVGVLARVDVAPRAADRPMTFALVTRECKTVLGEWRFVDVRGMDVCGLTAICCARAFGDRGRRRGDAGVDRCTEPALSADRLETKLKKWNKIQNELLFLAKYEKPKTKPLNVRHSTSS
ncbi:hypothetical protein C8J57DRAFT_1212501 [Mycena rebaudengoi]|nr:hypothetical protein C8J57DRAFT_1212501 [Mycena rebaudengoi]